MDKIYLDYNAASPLRDAVKQAYIHALDIYGKKSLLIAVLLLVILFLPVEQRNPII
jgi:hypothetical protein